MGGMWFLLSRYLSFDSKMDGLLQIHKTGHTHDGMPGYYLAFHIL